MPSGSTWWPSRRCDLSFPPLPIQVNSGLQIKTLTFEICSDADEKRSFFYYRDQTLQHLSSFKEYRFWDRLVVQASYAHEAVRRMVVALGAFNEAVDLTDDESSRKLHTMALEQYSRALEQTMNKIGHIAPEHLLIAACMFSYFEYIRGYPMPALRHLYSAISLLLQQQGATSQMPVIVDELRPILAATHIRASSLYPQVLQFPSAVQQVLPDGFTSMQNAHRHYLDIAQQISARLDRAYREDPSSPPEPSLGPRFLGQLNAWREGFVGSISSGRLTCNCAGPSAQVHFELGSLYLQAQYVLTVLRLQAAMEASEATFDARKEAITHIVQLCDRIKGITDQPGFNINRAAICLGFVPVLLPTLAVLGFRCREPALRRRILEMIRSISRGENGAALTADIIKAVMELEEGAAPADVVRDASDIPMEARITITSTTHFRENPLTKQFELLLDYGKPDLVRVRFLRLEGVVPAERQAQDKGKAKEQEQEPVEPVRGYGTLWLDLRSPTKRSDVPYPEDVQPLFPQILTTKTNLFSRYGASEEIMMARRASLCLIFVPPLPPPRARGDETPRRSFFINSISLGLMGAGQLAVSRPR